MELSKLGWDAGFAAEFDRRAKAGSLAARVTEENKGFYRVACEAGEYLTQLSGRDFHRTGERAVFPVVGDWVVITPHAREQRATLTAILPRRTALSRKQAGRAAGQQVLASNIDVVFIVTALNLEFNLRRLERYLAMVRESGARAVVLLNKADLCADTDALCAAAARAAPGATILAASAATGEGLAALRGLLAPGRTAALVGSSGVGKSSLLNALAGEALQHVQAARGSDDRGRHTTTSRHLLVLPCGALLIDTPGMRELELWDAAEPAPQSFDDIEALAPGCRFRNCRHGGEPGCAVEQAIASGALDRERLLNYQKIEAAARTATDKKESEARQAAKQRAKKSAKPRPPSSRE